MPTNLFFIIWTLGILIGIAFPVYQIFQNRATKAASDRFGKQLQQNPALGEAFARTLYKPVGWIDFEPGLDNKNLPTLLSRLPSQAGAFLIHYRQWVSKDSYLLITTVDYFRPNETGHELFTRVRRGTRVTYNLNFVVKLDAHKKKIFVLSDLYVTLVDKNLRADFAKAIFKMLQM